MRQIPAPAALVTTRPDGPSEPASQSQPPFNPVPHVSSHAAEDQRVNGALQDAPGRQADSGPAAGDHQLMDAEPAAEPSPGAQPPEVRAALPGGDGSGGPPPGLPYPGHADDGADARLMTYTEHLGELRDRLIKSAVGLGIAMVLSFALVPMIFEVLKAPVEGLRLIRTGVAEMLITYMKVAFIGGVVFSTPVWLYQLTMFVAPGLTREEKRYFFASLPGVLACFLLGVLFGYFVLMPPALNFLVHFGEDIAEPYIRVGDYVGVVTTLLFWIGVIFETPLVIFVLARVGVVTPAFLRRHRPYAIVGAFVIAAVITPTWDPVNQTLVAVPIVVLYELGILLSHIAVRARRRATAA